MIRSFNFWNIGAFVAALTAETVLGFPLSMWVALAQAMFIAGMLIGYGLLRGPS